ncbi:Subunit of the glycosylphosphatidylinositol transamidase complex-like protein [Savitreella phatthalungensis]
MLVFGTLAMLSLLVEAGEHLQIERLPRNHLRFLATFETAVEQTDSAVFPYQVRQLLARTIADEVDVRLTRGRWRDAWGPLPRTGSAVGGTGAEVQARFPPGSSREAWISLVNDLSSLLCASMNYIDSTRSYNTTQSDGRVAFFGALPTESVCTENLTPFLKLTPCRDQAGVGELIKGHDLAGMDWINLRLVVHRKGAEKLSLLQTIDFVVDVERQMLTQRGGLPGSQRAEDVQCAPDKFYTTDVTCLPLDQPHERRIVLTELFPDGKFLRCPMSSKSDFEVLLPSGDWVPLQDARNATITLNPELSCDANDLFVNRDLVIARSALHGHLSTTFTNASPSSRQVRYVTMLPWFMRPQLQTFAVSGNGTIESTRLIQGKQRNRPFVLDTSLTVAPGGEARLTFDFERTLLRFAEYPPDANRGFDIPAAVVRYTDRNGDIKELRTTGALLPLPTPDFSMPYNVIILTCTCIALIFGSIFNLLIRFPARHVALPGRDS